ncbi:MAG: hypothetical protein U5R46_18585 [Gammaproteobacteria bacterium]|nr:hypothetical protein [Gammaproteobacteria bacterium]
MWFKRQKKSEQDHALSESLRSLQSLLSETGRREPTLDPGDATPGDPGTEPPADRPSEPRPPRAANPEGVAQPQAAHRDGRRAEPEPPDSAGNRWRDLSLSFDAEPVLPRARHDDNTPDAEVPESDTEAEGAGEVQTVAAGAGDVPHKVSVETVDPPVPDEADDDPAAGSPDPETAPDEGDVPVETGEPSLEPLDQPPTPDVDDPPVPETVPVEPGAAAYPPEPDDQADGDVASDPGFRPRSDEEVLVLDLEEPGPPPAETRTGDAYDTDPDDDPGDPAPHDAAPAEDPRYTPGGEPLDEPGLDEQAEDQLHLELEPDGNADAGIPVLTNAVYVPDTPATQPAAPAFTPPDPAGSPHDEAIAQCVDNLRVRFQLMGLEALSPAQEKELHDALVDFLDDFQRG